MGVLVDLQKSSINADPFTPGNQPGWSSTPATHRRYVWDGWLLLEELNAASSNAVVKKYTWGLDLAGLNGSVNDRSSAGGIGGLLAMQIVSGTAAGDYAVMYDGSGNVTQLVRWDQSSEANARKAHYVYDPFGNLLSSSGTAASTNDFRFSTKLLDQETGLYYYGHRYYSPKLGRWVNRDPIGENGGLHLYGFVANQPPTLVDVLGEGIFTPGGPDPTGRPREFWVCGPRPPTDESCQALYELILASQRKVQCGLAVAGDAARVVGGTVECGVGAAICVASGGEAECGSWLMEHGGDTLTAGGAGLVLKCQGDWQHVPTAYEEKLLDDGWSPFCAGLIDGVPTTISCFAFEGATCAITMGGAAFKTGSAAGKCSAATGRGAAAYSYDGINPRLVNRLADWKFCKMRGDPIDFKTWFRQTEPTMGPFAPVPHGNTLSTPTPCWLYRATDKSGDFQKWGITQSPRGRYSGSSRRRTEIEPICVGPRRQMARSERWLSECDPGPKNCEPWAGSRVSNP